MSGSAPNRIFNIEWRAVYFADHKQTANFEMRLYENDPNKRFDFIFGTVQPGSDQQYVSGVQGPNNVFTQDFCEPARRRAGSRTYTCPGGGTPTPTPTATATPSDGHSYSYINAQTDAYAEVCANPETPSHPSAETVVVFAKAKHYRDRR